VRLIIADFFADVKPEKTFFKPSQSGKICFRFYIHMCIYTFCIIRKQF
jgi:hypothetical protein